MNKPPLSSFVGASTEKPSLASFSQSTSSTPLNGFATTDAKQMPAGQKAAMGIFSDIYKRGEGVIGTVERGAAALQDPKLGIFDKTKALLSTGLQTAGAVGGGVMDIIKGTTKSVASTLIPDAVAKPVKSAFGTAIDAIGNIPVVYGSQTKISDEAKFAVAGIKHLWDSLDPETQRNIEAAGNIGALLLANKTSPDVPTKEATKEAFATIPADIGKGKDAVVSSIKDAATKAKTAAQDLPGVKNYINSQAQDRAEAARLIAEGATGDARTAKYTLADSGVEKAIKDIKSSDSTQLFDDAIKEGSLKTEEVFSSGKILTTDAAKGRIDDVAAKLDNLEPGLGSEYRSRLAGKELTMDNIIKEGQDTLTGSVDKKLALDPLAKEAIKQGVDEGDVALVKSSSAADKAKMREMLNITENAKTNKAALERSSDVVGKTFADPARFVKKVNDEAAKKLDEVAAATLKGQKVDLSNAYTQYVDDLGKRGVTIGDDGKLVFDGSDFDGLDSVQKSLERMNTKFQTLEGGDAFNAHQVKRFIDEQVQYGKQAEGLTGGAERIVKNFRHNVDATLDDAFPAYNEINTQFAETRGYLDELQRLLGKSTPIGDELAPAKAGTLMRRVLSNAGSRTDVMRLISNTEELAKKYGYTMNESIINQVLFADTIEKMLGTEASTSLFGQVERAVRAAGAVKDLASGNILGAMTKGAGEVYNLAAGISDKAKIEALKKLLGQ